MQVITDKKAQEKSTFIIGVTFKDEDLNEVVPTSIVWSLIDSDSAIINSRNQVVIAPSSSIDIVLYGDDLQIKTGEISKASVRRYVIIEAVYNSDAGTGLKFNEQIGFVLENLKKIS